MSQAEFGMIGLGTMGRALLQNIADHGFCVSGWNRSQERLDLLLEEAAGTDIRGFTDLKAFVDSIRKPRVVMLLVPAGEATDEMIQRLLPLLEPGDFIIDGSNAHYRDTDRRSRELMGHGFGFLGLGVSGGETGARRGPSMMAGGTPEHYERVRSMLEAAAAKYAGEPCVALLGPSSAGHYVKMVHNGIEYGIMQVIAECYDVMTRVLGMSASECADAFEAWNRETYGSYLLEITVSALRHRDEESGEATVDLILDKAKAKGTGKWTSQDAMDLGVPVPTIDSAVTAREMSALKEERVHAASIYNDVELYESNVADLEKPDLEQVEATNQHISEHLSEFGITVTDWDSFFRHAGEPDRDTLLEGLKGALTVATIIAYAQGLAQLRTASSEYGYALDLQEVAKVWRAGCIIRSEFLEEIRQAYGRAPSLANLLVDEEISRTVGEHIEGLRQTLMLAIESEIPVPALSASLAYFDSYRSSKLPANLTQAQRDLFGAHTYERLDRAGSFHTAWGYE